MDIGKLTKQEKSVLLAKVHGARLVSGEELPVEVQPFGEAWKFGGKYYLQGIPDLYDPQHMHLAWLIHLWAIDPDGPWGYALAAGDFEYEGWLYEFGIWNRADAQTAWLDKILSLAIESGLVKSEE